MDLEQHAVLKQPRNPEQGESNATKMDHTKIHIGWRQPQSQWLVTVKVGQIEVPK